MNSKEAEAIEALAASHWVGIDLDKLQAWGETVEQGADYRRFLRLPKLDTDRHFYSLSGLAALCLTYAVNWVESVMEWAREHDDPELVRRTVTDVYPEATGPNDHERLINGTADDLHRRIIAAISTGDLRLYDGVMRAVDISTAAQTADALPALTGNGIAAAQMATERADDGAPGMAEATANTATRRVGRVRTAKLAALIARVTQNAADSNDSQSVWDALYKLADSKDRPVPLLGVADGSIKWLDQNGEGESVKFLTKKMLRDRLYRAKNRAG